MEIDELVIQMAMLMLVIVGLCAIAFIYYVFENDMEDICEPCVSCDYCEQQLNTTRGLNLALNSQNEGLLKELELKTPAVRSMRPEDYPNYPYEE